MTFMLLTAPIYPSRRDRRRHPRPLFGHEREEGDKTGALYRRREEPLVFCAVPRDASRQDLSALRDICAQARRVLIVDVDQLFGTEIAGFPFGPPLFLTGRFFDEDDMIGALSHVGGEQARDSPLHTSAVGGRAWTKNSRPRPGRSLPLYV